LMLDLLGEDCRPNWLALPWSTGNTMIVDNLNYFKEDSDDGL